MIHLEERREIQSSRRSGLSYYDCRGLEGSGTALDEIIHPVQGEDGSLKPNDMSMWNAIAKVLVVSTILKPLDKKHGVTRMELESKFSSGPATWGMHGR